MFRVGLVWNSDDALIDFLEIKPRVCVIIFEIREVKVNRVNHAFAKDIRNETSDSLGERLRGLLWKEVVAQRGANIERGCSSWNADLRSGYTSAMLSVGRIRHISVTRQRVMGRKCRRFGEMLGFARRV